jgi:hypothetical protein
MTKKLEEFNLTKYTKWYFNIINNARCRELPLNTYTEKHHIIPRCIGGTNEDDNLVKLTAREHFICHLLLTKMTTANYQKKMIFAFRFMSRYNSSQPRYINSRLFDKIKGRCTYTAESRVKMSIAKKGKKQTAESIEARASKMRGRVSPIKGKVIHTVSSKEKIRKAQQLIYADLSASEKFERMKKSGSSDDSWTDARKLKISEALKGKPKSEQAKTNMKEAAKHRTAEHKRKCGDIHRGKPWSDARRQAYLKKKGEYQ